MLANRKMSKLNGSTRRRQVAADRFLSGTPLQERWQAWIGRLAGPSGWRLVTRVDGKTSNPTRPHAWLSARGKLEVWAETQSNPHDHHVGRGGLAKVAYRVDHALAATSESKEKRSYTAHDDRIDLAIN